MWKKQGGRTAFAYSRDEATCSFCMQNKSRFYQYYCTPDFGCNCNGSKLISVEEDIVGGKPFLSFYLYSALPGDNEFGELEELRITLFEDSGVLEKEFCDCPYDDSLSLKLTGKEAMSIMESIPLIREGDIFPVLNGVKLNAFEGDKSGWLKEYQKKFNSIKSLLDNGAIVVPPSAESPVKGLHDLIFGKP